MKKLSMHRVIHSPPCQFTLGVVLALTLFSLTVNAQDTVFRTNASGTFSGTDVATVQTADGAANGDTLIITGDATHNSTVNLSSTYNTFTVRSGDPAANKTIQGESNPFYIITENGDYTIILSNVDYNGKGYKENGALSGIRSSFMRDADSVTSNITINADNVSFTGYRINYEEIYYGGVFDVASLRISGTSSESVISFSKNASGYNGSGGAICADNLQLSTGNFIFQNNNSDGGSTGGGGAIYCADKLEILSGTYSFQNNRGYTGGGAIYCANELIFSGDTNATFSGNRDNRGGAIYGAENSKLKFTGGTYTFENNNVIQFAGAIYNNGTLTFSGDNTTAIFTGNNASYYGGAIYSAENSNIQFTGGTYTFQNNTATMGSAIYSAGTVVFSGDNTTATFIGNSGNAIVSNKDFQISNGANIIFQNNEGSAIYCTNTSFATVTFSGDNTTATFIGNSGRAIKTGDFKISNGTYKFQNNYGGAVICYGAFTFSGDNTNATFTGNIADNQGNDIHCVNTEFNLGFTDRGTYSFDGGIVLAGMNSIMSIDQAQVMIAGRQFRPDDPTVEDTTNNYELKNVTISNGGNLTADLEYIEKLTGKFTFTGAESLFTQNKGADPAAKKTATIKSSDGNGVMNLTYEAQGGVSSESVFISSGRIDIKGCMEATIELQRNASFSPGNSAGKAEVDKFIAAAGAKLIFEKEGGVYDQLYANVVTIDPGAQIQLLFDSYAPGAVYDIIIANDALNVDQSWIDMIQRLLPEDFEALIYNGNIVRLQSTQEPLAAVPEPSTWALLILGAAGLLYVRKRK